MTFLDELKRRNVIRLAGLYLVGAWLIVQVSGTLLPIFDAPVWHAPANIARVYSFRDEADQAFVWLDRASNTDLADIAAESLFANIHGDPRWLPLLRKLGMAPEQLAAIKFDVKAPR